jgi:hypothetical protein
MIFGGSATENPFLARCVVAASTELRRFFVCGLAWSVTTRFDHSGPPHSSVNLILAFRSPLLYFVP